MLNPRLQDPDFVIESAEALVARAGIEALTIRALTKASGVSNGAIYRTFDSRGGLLGRLWIRAERRFLALLTSQVDEARNRRGGDPMDELLAAAEASLFYPELYPGSAALLLALRRADVLSQPMPREIAKQLRDLDCELGEITSQLAARLWDRNDADAVDLIATCIIDLPKWIAMRGRRYSSAILGEYLRAAVRSVLEVGPPALGSGRESTPNCVMHPSGCVRSAVQVER